MSHRRPVSPATAIVYTEGHLIDIGMRDIALHLISLKWNLAGFVQLNEPQIGRSRCAMSLQELWSGAIVGISEDRGPEARGCMLNIAELARASALAATALESKPDLLVINKFGKTEVAGRGFRSLIGEALVRNIPLLIAIPEVNLAEWQHYSAGLSSDYRHESLHADTCRAVEQLGLVGFAELPPQGSSMIVRAA